MGEEPGRGKKFVGEMIGYVISALCFGVQKRSWEGVG